MKDPSAVPVANPLGSLLAEFTYAKYSSAVENSGSVSGVSRDDDMDLEVVVVDDLVTDGDEETVNADDRAATTIERIKSSVEEYHAITF
jgi:hypothetical protein